MSSSASKPLHIGGIRLSEVELPGRAGELQRGRATASLIRELGDNYGTYHAFLAARLRAIGGRPRPDDFPSFAEYTQAWAEVQAIVRAEAILRISYSFRRSGRSLDAGFDRKVALVDDEDRLISAI